MRFSAHRRPRTTQEKRANGPRNGRGMFEGHPVRIRSKRNACRLPSSWDDLLAFSDHRSWKRSRLTQYRPVEI